MVYLNKITALLIGVSFIALTVNAYAAESGLTSSGGTGKAADRSEPSTFVADAVSYDDAKQLIIASGKVEISNSQHILLADKIVFDQKTNQIAAQGHVVLYQATGDVIFGDKMQLTSDMRDGFMTAVGVVLPDNTRIAATAGERFSGRFLRLYNGVYSPYPLDAEDPTAPPLWQLQASEIVHDEGTHDLIYHNATFDLYGLPALYTPYIATPDPTVKRRSGFLTPTLGFGGTLGTNLRTPYYYDVEPETDLVITPWLTERDGAQADVIMRHRFINGTLTGEASGTVADNPTSTGETESGVFRGHFRSDGIFDFSDGWRAGEDLLLETDDSYLVLYKYSAASILTNRIYTENFDNRNYFVTNAYYFINTIPGITAQPLAAPDMQYSALGKPGDFLGGRWSFQSGFLDLAHDGAAETDVQRGSLAGGWERKFYTNVGMVGTLDANIRDDVYFTHNLQDEDNPNVVADQVDANRLFPSANATASYPVAKQYDTVQQTIEPTVSLFTAPTPHENSIPNIDSQDYELDATNIFQPNGFSGIDRLEGGTRATYGVKTGVYGQGGGSSSLFLGQSYAFTSDPQIPVDSGFNGHRSDVVGQLQVYPSSLLTFDYNFRLDSNDLSPNLHEADVIVGNKKLRVALDYLYIEEPLFAEEYGGSALRQQITYGVNSAITDYWTVAAAQTVDMTGEGVLTSSLRLIYQDEGITFSVTANVNNTDRTGLDNGLEVLTQVSFKGFGGSTLQPIDVSTFSGMRTTPY